ncbi:MAG: aldolase/citrate lyase family protein [Melioribacteraceae bacterium]
MNSIELKEKIKLGERIYGTAIVSASEKWPDVVKNAGLDFVFIDTEHIALGRETVANMCNTYSALGLLPMVRIPSPDPYNVCTVLDGGAVAVLVPYIESVEQVKSLVGATKYRPIKGGKLKQILDNPSEIDSKLKAYIDDRCKDNLLFINIESKSAVDNLTELLTVPGIDGVIIGPHDLSCSMGIPEEYNNPVFEEAVTKIIEECNSRNLGIGIHLSEEPEQQIKWANVGANIILHSSDISLFNKKLTNDITKIKNNLENSTNKNESNSIII